jgi:hypothetical protein
MKFLFLLQSWLPLVHRTSCLMFLVLPCVISGTRDSLRACFRIIIPERSLQFCTC